jgi:hypothetical protein
LKANRRFGYVASIFRIEEQTKHESSVEAGGKKMVAETSDYTVLYPRNDDSPVS